MCGCDRSFVRLQTVSGNLNSLINYNWCENRSFEPARGFQPYSVAQKNISYFLEPINQRGVPNAYVNSEPMVSQNTVKQNIFNFVADR